MTKAAITPLPDPSGARRLIEQTVEAEPAVPLAAHADETTTPFRHQPLSASRASDGQDRRPSHS